MISCLRSLLRSFRIFSLFLPQHISDLTLVNFCILPFCSDGCSRSRCSVLALCPAAVISVQPLPQHASLLVQTLQEHSHRACICVSLPPHPEWICSYGPFSFSFLVILFRYSNHRNTFLHAFLVYSAPHRNRVPQAQKIKCHKCKTIEIKKVQQDLVVNWGEGSGGKLSVD